MFNKDIKFKYPWRPYQQKVLNQVEKYIEDKKVHIVAAPGSGKTILGLELARYLKNPVIIFAPTVTIKNQWVDRFVSSFTNYEKMGESYKDSPMAEAVGFEPTCPCGQLDFESSSLRPLRYASV